MAAPAPAGLRHRAWGDDRGAGGGLAAAPDGVAGRDQDRGLFRENAQGQIENIYLLKVINKTERIRHYELRLLDADGFSLQGKTSFMIPAGEMSELPVSVAMLAERPASSSQVLSFEISERNDPTIRSVAHSRFVAPMKR